MSNDIQKTFYEVVTYLENWWSKNGMKISTKFFSHLLALKNFDFFFFPKKLKFLSTQNNVEGFFKMEEIVLIPESSSFKLLKNAFLNKLKNFAQCKGRNC